MKYKVILCFFVLFLSCLNLIQAAQIADPNDSISNDITYILPDEHDNVYGYYVKRFDSYVIGTSNTYVYNDGAGSSSTAGAIKIRGMTNKSIHFESKNIQDAGTITVGLFMANGTITPTSWVTISETVYSGTQTGSIACPQTHDYDRIGIKRSGTSTADITIKETYTRQWKN